LPVGIGLPDTGIDREAFAPHQTLTHAAAHYAFEHVPEHVTLAESPMPVLGKGRVIWHGIFQSEPAEPAIREVQMCLLAQSSFGAHAEAVADQQHAQHQLRVH